MAARLVRAGARAVDTIVDRSVVLGYSSIGPAIRRHLPTWPADPAPNGLRDKHILVTGAASGLGLQTAIDAATLGGHIHLLVRDEGKGRHAASAVAEHVGRDDSTTTWTCDLADLRSVHAFSDAFVRSGSPLDAIVHNAGVMPAQRDESAQGHELTMAVHVLAPIALTEALRPVLAGRRARVVFVTSGGMYTQSLPVDDLEYRREPYSGAVAYARSKRAQVELVPVLQQRWQGDGIEIYATHPGWAATPGLTQSLPRFDRLLRPILRSPQAGVDTTVWLLAQHPPLAGGELWHDRRVRPTSYFGRHRCNDSDRRTLEQWVAATTG